ncbi:MAG: ATP12 family chaperone protein [Novosphingobium sp.]
MKRFWKDAVVAAVEGGWQVLLDGRAVKTQGGSAQVVTSRALAGALAAEWTAQGEEIDPQSLPLRDLADLAIDVIAPDRTGAVAQLLRYGETDTLCYRADPDEPLHARQIEVWEPLLKAAETRWDLHFERVSGIIHRPQSAATLAQLEKALAAQSDFTLAALTTLTSLVASLVIGLAAIEPDADVGALWAAAELEELWQVELWGEDAEAAQRRARRFAAFRNAARFAALTRT